MKNHAIIVSFHAEQREEIHSINNLRVMMRQSTPSRRNKYASCGHKPMVKHGGNRRIKCKVRFRVIDEMKDVQLIETRKELSRQEQQLRWYRNSDIDAMRKAAHLVTKFIKKFGMKSEAVQMGLKMEVFDLRGLELGIDVARSIEKYQARKSIISYYKSYKWDTTGLSLISQYITANAARLACTSGYYDACVATELYTEQFLMGNTVDDKRESSSI